MANKETVRSLAVSSLLKIEKSGRYSNLEINSAIGSRKWSDPDKKLFSRLVYGVTEKRLTLDCVIGQYSKLPVCRLDPECRAALRLGIYQLLFSDRIPDHAAVSETVGAVRERYRGYVNGVLRSFLRADKKFDLPDPANADEYIPAVYSVSPAVFRVLSGSYGRKKAEEIISSFDGEGPVCLRLNTQKSVDPDVLRAIGPEPAPEPLLGIAVTVPSVSDAVRRGIAEGLWFVEDFSSILCAETLGAIPGDTVADVCAAPGGKTFSTALRMKNEGRVLSFDLHENKLSLIRDGAARLGVGIVTAAARDGRDPDPALAGVCDRVLCDVPCSGLGVIGKKPELRYKTEDDFARLPSLQREILLASSRLTAPGGVLVYSTCTLNRAENEDVAASLRESDPSFEPFDFEIPGIGKSEQGMLTIFPGGDCRRDGFFISRFRRVK